MQVLELALPIYLGLREIIKVLISCSFPISTAGVWFGPKAAAGMECYSVQTIPGKGRLTLLRFYGPLEPWFNKTWPPAEIELQP